MLNFILTQSVAKIVSNLIQILTKIHELLGIEKPSERRAIQLQYLKSSFKVHFNYWVSLLKANLW